MSYGLLYTINFEWVLKNIHLMAKYISYLFFRLFSALVKITPFSVMYFFSDAMSVLLYRIIKYRKKVIIDNLTKSFPEKTEAEIALICRRFYLNFTDMMIETVKGLDLKSEKDQKRFKLMNPELLDKYAEQNKNTIIAMGHFGNWEWLGPFLKSGIVPTPYALYKPLRNKWIDKHIKETRAKEGLKLQPIKQTRQLFSVNEAKPKAVLMISDQSPGNIKNAIWLRFLNQNTPFLHGIEFYSRFYDLPVIFLKVERVKRGYYEAYFSVLSEKPAELQPNEITKLYAKQLEKDIIASPEQWLWSHKRWKKSHLAPNA